MAATARADSQVAGPATKSLDETAKAWDNTPLFMRQLPAAGEMDDYLSTQMEALQSLLYDGDAEEQAQNFKEQGNAKFKVKNYKNAINFYTQGLGNLAPELQEETKRTLWCNRAACHLELGNYRSCLRDCALVLAPSDKPITAEDQDTHTNTSLKALFRSLKALLALEKLDEAKDAMERYRGNGGMLNASVQQIEKQLNQKLAYRDTVRSEAAERARRQELSDDSLRQALVASGLRLKAKWTAAQARTAAPPEVTPAHFDPEIVPVASTSQIPLSRPQEWMAPPSETPLIFPVFFLRPLAQPPTRDLILSFAQDVTFGAQLDAFNGRDNVRAQNRKQEPENVYAVTQQGRILKVGRNLSLKQIIKACVKDTDGLELVDGWCLEFFIVPAGGDEEKNWIADMKRRLKE